MACPSVATALGKGIEFLAEHQLRSGQFNVEYVLERLPPARPFATADRSPFATSHIVYSLGFSNQPQSKRIISRALDYFQAQQTGPGLWRYWDKGHPGHASIPPDLDDSASISYLLSRAAILIPNNRSLFLLNRNVRGLFYTWLIPRQSRTRNLRYWKQVLLDSNPLRTFFFWRATEAARDDLDAVVNANVLLYLGECPETDPIVDWLIEIVHYGREAECDKWYRDPFTFYYALSRTYREGVARFESVRDTIVERITRAAQPDGSLGENPLQTALALNTLCNFRADLPLVEPAIAHLVRTQHEDGAWRRYPFYYGGPKRLSWWGSEELTTGFCIEALERFTLWQ